MQKEIIASFTGKIVEIANGIVESGAPLFTTESMKMFVKENAPASGVLQTVAAVGATVIVGEVICYFTYTL